MVGASRKVNWPSTQLLRRLTQVGFGLFIIVSSIRHNVVTTEHLASIDAYCPFGGFATLWRWLSSGGLFVQKTHQSNLVLLLGLIAGVILAGGAFCGWICPFGAFQDLLNWIRKKLHLPEIKVPARLDRVLGYGRYLTLALILYATISTVKLWFADYDPYRTIFGLGWIFEFNLAEHWPAYAVALVVTVGAPVGRAFLVPLPLPAGWGHQHPGQPEPAAHPARGRLAAWAAPSATLPARSRSTWPKPIRRSRPTVSAAWSAWTSAPGTAP